MMDDICGSKFAKLTNMLLQIDGYLRDELGETLDGIDDLKAACGSDKIAKPLRLMLDDYNRVTHAIREAIRHAEQGERHLGIAAALLSRVGRVSSVSSKAAVK